MKFLIITSNPSHGIVVCDQSYDNRRILSMLLYDGTNNKLHFFLAAAMLPCKYIYLVPRAARS